VSALSEADLVEMLTSQGAAPSHVRRLLDLKRLCQSTSYCLALALVGSFAQRRADRISDLDLVAFVSSNDGQALMQQADRLLRRDDLVQCYGRNVPGKAEFGKYVYLDFSSCEFFVFPPGVSFKLWRPFVAVWDPNHHLQSLVAEGPPPKHETFEPYPHGDEGLIWELIDCVKWLQRGRTGLAKNYLRRLGRALGDDE
jgi:hypothetical protein